VSSRIESLAARKILRGVEHADESGRTIPQFEFIAVSDLLKQPAPLVWAIRGILLHGTTSALIGAPSTFKSFGAVDMAACIATGTDWHGRPTRQGPVFYLAGEGNAGLGRRFKAWEIANSSLDNAPLFVSKTGAGLTDPLNAAAVAAEVQRMSDINGVAPAFVVVDTLARNFGPGDENSTADMGRFIENLDRHIREPFGCGVSIAHHTGLSDGARARGSSALRAALDTEILFERIGDAVTLRCTKSKDAPEFDPIAFRTWVITLPWDGEDGQPETSFVLQPGEMPAKDSTDRGLGKNAAKMISVLERLYDEARECLVNGGREPKQALVRLDAWRKECELPKSSFYKGRESLEYMGRIKIEMPHVMLANNGVAYVPE
jgi:hypothetical protein